MVGHIPKLGLVAKRISSLGGSLEAHLSITGTKWNASMFSNIQNEKFSKFYNLVFDGDLQLLAIVAFTRSVFHRITDVKPDQNSWANDQF